MMLLGMGLAAAVATPVAQTNVRLLMAVTAVCGCWAFGDWCWLIAGGCDVVVTTGIGAGTTLGAAIPT